MARKNKILIVDDDENITNLISIYLTKECFETQTASDGEEAIEVFNEFQPDIILLDVMIPEPDGYEVLRRLRTHSNTPVIMISAKTEVFDKVLAFKLGADDYISKPFDANELVARVKAVLRRSNTTTSSQFGAKDKILEFKDLVINLSNYDVIYKGQKVEMTPKEIELLYFLASTPNHVYTREQLLNNLWGYDFSGDTRTVDVHIKRIREKVPDTDEWRIGTVWGIGYRFENLKEE